ncbi:MAG: hypothetical protein U9M90_01820 [Patescibacteria group bacterium]|nr:hypothetical protein [Patescibacteria group bacterium]
MVYGIKIYIQFFKVFCSLKGGDFQASRTRKLLWLLFFCEPKEREKQIMKKFVVFVMIFAFMAIAPIAPIVIGCDDPPPPDPSCEDIWVGGGNDQHQWQDFAKGELTSGGVFENSGGQHVNNWGAITGSGGYGEYSSTTMQAEGMDLTNTIPGGEVFNRHQAAQNANIDISGNDADAWISGDNEFSSKTVVYADYPPCGNDIITGSENSGSLEMDASLCVHGGTAEYTSEVITETGHFQELDLPGGTGFTSSYSGQRGYVELKGDG